MMKRLLRIISTMLLPVLGLVLSACCDDCEFPLENGDNLHYATVFENRQYNDLFTRYGGGWTGGNGGYSLALPDGRILWLFGTTFLDTVYADRTRPADAKFIRNSFVITNGNTFQTLYKGTPENPRPMIEHEDPNYYYVPMGGQIIGDTLELICEVCKEYGVIQDVGNDVGIELVRLSLPNFQQIDNTLILNTDKACFGFCLFKDSGYTYILGAESPSHGTDAYIARVPQGSLLQSWEFLTLYGWSQSLQDLRSIFDAAYQRYSVFKRDNEYFLLTSKWSVGYTIALYKATIFPVKWKSVDILYSFPEMASTRIYGAQIVDPLSTYDELGVIYNVTIYPTDGTTNSADDFRVYFFKICDWLD